MATEKYVARRIKGEFEDAVTVENGNNAVYIDSAQSVDTHTTSVFKPDAARKVAQEILEAADRAEAWK